MRSGNLQLACVQPATSLNKYDGHQGRDGHHGCHGHHGRHGRHGHHVLQRVCEVLLFAKDV